MPSEAMLPPLQTKGAMVGMQSLTGCNVMSQAISQQSLQKTASFYFS